MSLAEKVKKALNDPDSQEFKDLLQLTTRLFCAKDDEKEKLDSEIEEQCHNPFYMSPFRRSDDSEEYRTELKTRIESLLNDNTAEVKEDSKEIIHDASEVFKELVEKEDKLASIGARMRKSRNCEFCEKHPCEERKAFIEELQKEGDEIKPHLIPLMIKYVELMEKHFNILNTQKKNAMIAKLKKYKENCAKYLAKKQTKETIIEFIMQNFDCDRVNSINHKHTLPIGAGTTDIWVTDKKGKICSYTSDTDLNLFEHVDPVFNVLRLKFK